jgi:hypothetical protein
VRRLLTVVVVLGLLGGGADIGARQWAEGQIETRARAELPSQVSVAVHIRGFPFLLPLLVAGKVSEADGHFENVPAGALTLSAVDVELHGVRINRHKLFNDRKVEIERIDRGTVSIEISAAVLSRALGGVPVAIANGQLRVTVGGVTAVAGLSVRDNALVFDVAGVVQRVAIPKTALVPCATNVTVLAGRVRLTCTIHDVPPALLGAANRQLNR